jgi:hypothetical protein
MFFKFIYLILGAISSCPLYLLRLKKPQKDIASIWARLSNKFLFMHQFTLEILFKIIGIGSASGLLLHNDSLFIISDNSTFLYEYSIAKKEYSKIKLLENSQENIPKKQKLDFESITQKGKELYIFGSGSKPKRERQLIYNLKNQKTEEKDLTLFYQKLKSNGSISDKDMNIEGAVFYKNDLILFQRGNGNGAKNGIFIYNTKKETSKYIALPLPKLKTVEATFTDAVLVDDTIYFLASAEDSKSTYKDGEILGSLIGSINTKTWSVNFTKQITETQKFEGLAFYKNSKESIEFLLCEDNDTEELQSNIYKLVLKKQ